MTIIAMMVVFYSIMCFTNMKRIAMIYLFFSIANLFAYPIAENLFQEGIIFYPVTYAIGEEFAKIYLIVALCNRMHAELVFLLFLHMLNHGFVYEGYELVNNVLITLEMTYFITGAKRDLNGFYKSAYDRIIRKHGDNCRTV